MDNLAKKHWRDLMQCVTDVVNAADPMGLLELGLPSDEYESQAMEVLSAYLRIGRDVEALTLAIHDTFDRWFGIASVPIARCRLIASRLCEVLPTVDSRPIQ